MSNLIILLCWFVVEFIIVFVHASLVIQLIGQDAFLKNTPDQFVNKIMLIILNCAVISGMIGICFFKLASM